MTSLHTRFWEWQDAQPEPAFVNNWRTPSRTRTLIITYFTGLILGIGLEVAALWKLHLIWPAIAGLVVSMTAWTLLRWTIHSKDTAPRTALDDYEQQVLDLWRARALTIVGTMLFLGAFCTIVLGVIFSDTFGLAPFAAVVGLYMIFIYLAVTTLPAVGYALSFNQPVDKE